MPLYEYRCKGCRRRVTVLVRESSESRPTCPHCGSSELTRLFSSFSVRKSDADVYENILSDNQLVRGLMHDDARALAEWNKRMTRGTDYDTAPEYEEMLEKMEAGEVPDLGEPKEKKPEE